MPKERMKMNASTIILQAPQAKISQTSETVV